jgi:hypothetical protein
MRKSCGGWISQAAVAFVLALTLTLPLIGQVRSPKKEECRYEIRLEAAMAANEPVRLAGKSRTDSIVFYAERKRLPAAGSALHLFLRHSPDLDGTRSFVSVSLNYALLRSLRLDYGAETEIVIPLNSDLLKDKNELLFSVQQLPRPGIGSPQLWTEIGSRSFVLVRCRHAPRCWIWDSCHIRCWTRMVRTISGSACFCRNGSQRKLWKRQRCSLRISRAAPTALDRDSPPCGLPIPSTPSPTRL